MSDPIEPGQLANIVTAWRMRDWLAPTGEDYFKDHPLLLPRYRQDDARWDFSKLRVRLPAGPLEDPKTPVEDMLEPLIALCERHRRKMPEGMWVYEWFYFELLDRDGDVQPLCWISPKLLYEHHFDRADEAAIAAAYGRYPRRLVTMDYIASVPPDGSETDRLAREEWGEWLEETWTAKEAAWKKKRWLSYDTAEPWTTQLAFDGKSVIEGFERWPSDKEGEASLPQWRRRADAGYPGLYWQMVPLYDSKDMSHVWQAMKRETFVTSVFNAEAHADQDRALWRTLEKRFALRYQRMTLRRHWSRMRDERVLEWSREGVGLVDMADRLIREGLYPLPKGDVRRPIPEENWEVKSDDARRTVVRIRNELRNRGKIQERKRGRPRKR